MIRVSQTCRRSALVVLLLVLVPVLAVAAASKPHIIVFGKWITVQWTAEFNVAGEAEKLSVKVRPLLIDARVKEFTFGAAHEVTDRLFVVRRAFPLNDNLPEESVSPPHWQWQQAGWLLVDRLTGHITSLNLPEFDAVYSAGSWYRDYVAYCGISDDGKKLYAVVAQINRRKPVLKKLLEPPAKGTGELREATAIWACAPPRWQRNPSRVTFESAGGSQQTFTIRGRVADLITEEDDDEGAAK